MQRHVHTHSPIDKTVADSAAQLIDCLHAQVSVRVDNSHNQPKSDKPSQSQHSDCMGPVMGAAGCGVRCAASNFEKCVVVVVQQPHASSILTTLAVP
jgi:hypothetical protein